MVLPAGLGHLPNATELETEIQTGECCARVHDAVKVFAIDVGRVFHLGSKAAAKLRAGEMTCLL